MSTTGSVLGELKGFQLETVEYVFERLYGAEPVSRFLIADEVGLGKTMVARGLIAKAVEHLSAAGSERVDIVYVCSNQSIARQNIPKLALTGKRHKPQIDRATMLPVHLGDLDANRVNFVPLTPQTSFDLRSQPGKRRERVLIWWLLREHFGRRWMRRQGVLRLLQGTCWTPAGFERALRSDIDPGQIDPGLAAAFIAAMRRDEALLARFEELAHRFSYARHPDRGLRSERAKLTGDLRRKLARSCLDALQPDVVILDEFQRYRELLEESTPAGSLAMRLFGRPETKILLLSATPYRMLTRDVEGDGEGHHEAFLKTIRFLFEGDSAKVEDVRAGLREFRAALQQQDKTCAKAAKRTLERELGQVMVRTEKLAGGSSRNGMVKPVRSRPATTAGDLRSFAELDRVARELEQRDVLEYWKSVPFPLNFMDEYALSREFERQAKSDGRVRLRRGALPCKRVRGYEAVDLGNARLRALAEETIGNGHWRLLWLPASLPYYEDGKPFSSIGGSPTKRLVFSAWTAIPRALACLATYEAERHLIASDPSSGPRRNTPEARKKVSSPLRFAQDRRLGSAGSAASMTTFAALYPSAALAARIDPLEIARANGGPVSRQEALGEAERRVRRALKGILPRQRRGPEDSSWYAAAPLLIDYAEDPAGTRAWIESGDARSAIGSRHESPFEESNWELHLDRAAEILDGRELGRPPRDLARIVALMALASPAVAARRALDRVAPGASESSLRTAALRVADGFRSLFSLPEVIPLVRGTHTTRRYWEDMLRYCFHGNLQAVLDEYGHVLREWAEIDGDEPDDGVTAIGAAMVNALSTRAPDFEVREIGSGSGELLDSRMKMRTRFAQRFGAAGADEERQGAWADHVRRAFNSPFWPFVLATTSVGQEGLDFHLYCHAVVHWNLPANPVDFEQREGRVHRYKGHAVRRNLARTCGKFAFAGSDRDPWAEMFRRAEHRDGDIEPYWVLTGGEDGARIERYVPASPWSRDAERMRRLERHMGSYRLTMGQSRQDDLLALFGRLGEDELQALSKLAIDLTPGRAIEARRDGTGVSHG